MQTKLVNPLSNRINSLMHRTFLKKQKQLFRVSDVVPSVEVSLRPSLHIQYEIWGQHVENRSLLK